MSVVLVATLQHVMTDKQMNFMILSGTINTKRQFVNEKLSPDTRFSYVMVSVILTGYGPITLPLRSTPRARLRLQMATERVI
jgi:hypothetical protein